MNFNDRYGSTVRREAMLGAASPPRGPKAAWAGLVKAVADFSPHVMLFHSITSLVGVHQRAAKTQLRISEIFPLKMTIIAGKLGGLPQIHRALMSSFDFCDRHFVPIHHLKGEMQREIWDIVEQVDDHFVGVVKHGRPLLAGSRLPAPVHVQRST